MLSDGRYVDKGGGGVLGCVIVGANTDYNLMFYDSAKRTVFLAPITKYLTVKGLQTCTNHTCMSYFLVSHTKSLPSVPALPSLYLLQGCLITMLV